MSAINYNIICDKFYQLTQTHIVPFHKNLHTNEIYDKGLDDVVTSIDITMERELTAMLHGITPHIPVLGEEYFSTNRHHATTISQQESFWVVDPLDGTRNFVRGSDNFCSMLAHVYKGETIFSCIILPHKQCYYYALKGSGAYDNTHKPLQKVAKNPIMDSSMMNGQINFSLFSSYHQASYKKQANQDFAAINRVGSAGIDFVNLALGLHDFSIYRFLWWWDHIPGILLLQEMQGYVKRLDNNMYRACLPVRRVICASNKQIGDYMHDYIHDKFKYDIHHISS